MFKKVLIVIPIILLPVILCFMIWNQISEIRKSRNEFNLSEGRIENIGMMERLHNGSYKSPSSRSIVLFIKLKNNDTLYLYFSRSVEKNAALRRNLKTGDVIKIFNENYDENQNTVDIVELEKETKILISKSEYNTKSYKMLSLFSVFLILYFYIPYKFVYLKSKH